MLKVTLILFVISALGTILKGTVKRQGNEEIRGRRKIIKDFYIFKIRQKTEKSPGDL